MDVYIDRKDRVFIVDFNVFGGDTDPMLFSWKELVAASNAATTTDGAGGTTTKHNARAPCKHATAGGGDGESRSVAVDSGGGGAAGAGAGTGTKNDDAGAAPTASSPPSRGSATRREDGESRSVAGDSGAGSGAAGAGAGAGASDGGEGVVASTGAPSGRGSKACAELPLVRVVEDERGVLFNALAHHGLPQDMLDVGTPEAMARLRELTLQQQREGV